MEQELQFPCCVRLAGAAYSHMHTFPAALTQRTCVCAYTRRHIMRTHLHWPWLCFFALHGLLVAAEQAVKARVRSSSASSACSSGSGSGAHEGGQHAVAAHGLPSPLPLNAAAARALQHVHPIARTAATLACLHVSACILFYPALCDRVFLGRVRASLAASCAQVSEVGCAWRRRPLAKLRPQRCPVMSADQRGRAYKSGQCRPATDGALDGKAHLMPEALCSPAAARSLQVGRCCQP